MEDYNWDYTDLILRHSYPEQDGWSVELNYSAGDFDLDYVFLRKNSEIVFVQHMDGVYVKQDDIKLANSILNEFKHSKCNYDKKVILVYGKLLIPPGKLPSNITVVSASEGTENTKPLMANVCLN